VKFSPATVEHAGAKRSPDLGRSETTIPIPGFKTAAQVEENAKAMEAGPLTLEQMKEIDAVLGR
jgi:aryl-alcohol dehydrogenase-like predicted oxidoreductase